MDYNNIDDEALRRAIEGVKDNNRINDARWTDWDDASHVAEVYRVDYGNAETAAIIDRAIESDGASLAEDLPAVERAVWGHNFSGSFWDRHAE